MKIIQENIINIKFNISLLSIFLSIINESNIFSNTIDSIKGSEIYFNSIQLKYFFINSNISSKLIK